MTLKELYDGFLILLIRLMFVLVVAVFVVFLATLLWRMLS